MRRNLTHEVMREVDAPANWDDERRVWQRVRGFFPVQVRFTPAHERFHLALCSPGRRLSALDAGSGEWWWTAFRRRSGATYLHACRDQSHAGACRDTGLRRDISVNDIIHILMAEGGQA
ncbi:conjugation system SOS inhibitor PsiB family protein [Escherichia coli]|uniref:conjugation system SOS inhibitor PsiB family protein n=1 Tax=Escherichia coli TaxID=562 RepID=UPI000E05A948|nr:conjugation system SOS inhibitor PsiB family protein [Escherichia coli]STJ26659.1 plasmid SOS inhibition protein B [Escherichia coli]